MSLVRAARVLPRVLPSLLGGVIAVGLVVGPLAGSAAARPNTGPAPVLTTTPKTPTNNTSASFAWTGTNQYFCYLDAARVGCSSSGSNWSYTTATKLADGLHTFLVKTNGRKQKPVSYAWRVDTVAPAAPSLVEPPRTTRATSAAISFTDSDPDVVGFTCALDSGTATPCTSPYVVTGLGNGDHTATITAYDAAGNGAPASTLWTVDPHAADVPVVVGPPTPTNKTSASISFSTVNTATFKCALDSATPADCSSPVPVSNLSDGTHVFTVTATDTAANSFSGEARWVVDTIAPPSPTLITGPAAITDDTSPSIIFTDSDPTGVHYQCTVTDTTTGTTAVATAACASPWDFNLDPNTADGDHFSATIVPVDGAGNVGSPLVVTWVLDQTISPSPPVWLATPGSPSANPSPTFTFDAPDYGSSGGATGFVCSLTGANGTAAVSCPGTVDATGTSLTGSFTPSSPLADGSYALSVATTNGSAQSSPLVYAWAIDTSAPPAPHVPDPGQNPNPTITFTDADPSITFLCSVDGGPAVACSSPWTPPAGLADGQHTLVVTAVDRAGNKTSSPPIKFIVRSGAGQTSIPSVLSITTPSTLTDPAIVTFSETVKSLVPGSIRMVVAGSTKTVGTAVVCVASSGVAPCSGQWISVRLSPTSPLVVGQHYAVVVDARAARNASGTATTAASKAFRAARAVEENNTVVHPSWRRVGAKAAYGGSYVREQLAGASAAWRFTGRSVTWWTVTGPDQGKATVFIDGVRKAYVDNYASTTHYKVARLYGQLANKSHVLRIVVRGFKGANAGTGSFVSVDAMSVGKTRSNTPALATTWRSVAGKYSAGRAVTASQSGDTLTMAFRGTGVAFYTVRDANQGKVAVYVDGVKKATFDDYATSTSYGVKRLVSGLSDAVHTVKLVVLGTHHKGAKGSLVTVDRFLVS